MTFDNLKSFLEKRGRRSAILDADFKIIWDKDGFFSSWKKINFPCKEDFYDKKELIISLGSEKSKIPVSITKFILSGGETYYICEAYDKETVSELASKSEISEILKNYLSGINDKIHAIQFLADQCAQNPLVKSDKALLVNYKNQAGAAFDLLALSTNLNYYFNTFSYTESDSKIEIFKTIEELIQKCNKLLGRTVITLSSKERDRMVKIPNRVFTVVFLNLIQNALLFSNSDSKIDVNVYFDGDNATMSVTNEVDTNQPPASENIRLGIGLPIVERIVLNIGGKVFNEREGSTYKARITLPLYSKSGDEDVIFKSGHTEFITQNTSYVRRYLNQFIEK